MSAELGLLLGTMISRAKLGSGARVPRARRAIRVSRSRSLRGTSGSGLGVRGMMSSDLGASVYCNEHRLNNKSDAEKGWMLTTRTVAEDVHCSWRVAWVNELSRVRRSRRSSRKLGGPSSIL